MSMSMKMSMKMKMMIVVVVVIVTKKSLLACPPPRLSAPLPPLPKKEKTIEKEKSKTPSTTLLLPESLPFHFIRSDRKINPSMKFFFFHLFHCLSFQSSTFVDHISPCLPSLFYLNDPPLDFYKSKTRGWVVGVFAGRNLSTCLF